MGAVSGFEYTHFNLQSASISPEGARLDFSGPVSTPDVFDLCIPQKQQMLGASVVWRNGEEVGVAFARAPEAERPVKANDLAHRVARMEADIEILKRACRRLMPSVVDI